MQSRASRLARGWIAGSFATAVASVGHGLADGAAPSLLAIGAGVLFAGILGTLTIGRRPSLPRLAAIVAGSQVAFHLLFSALTPGTSVVGHHGTATLLGGPAVHHGTSPLMWAAHAVALVATLWFLRRAELALWNLLRGAFGVVTGERLPALAGLPAPGRAVPGSGPRDPVALVFSCVLSRRGPPLCVPA